MTYDEFTKKMNANGFAVIQPRFDPEHYEVVSYESDGDCVAIISKNASGNVMFHGEMSVKLANIILMFAETPITKRSGTTLNSMLKGYEVADKLFSTDFLRALGKLFTEATDDTKRDTKGD